MDYDIKRGHYSSIEGDRLKELMREVFGEVTDEDGFLVSSYGAIRSMKVKLLGKSSLQVEVISDGEVSDEVAMGTIKKYNEFLEKATGFSSKQRKDRLNKKAKEGKL